MTVLRGLKRCMVWWASADDEGYEIFRRGKKGGGGWWGVGSTSVAFHRITETWKQMAQLGREEHSGGERERLSLLYLSASNKYTKHNRTDACVIFVMQRCQLPVFRSSTTTANLNNSASLYTRDVPGQPKKTKTKNLYIRFWKNKRVVQKKNRLVLASSSC